ncbi:MAG: hypothetical protein U0414_36280 [Polyangiaceae bacterium]
MSDSHSARSGLRSPELRLRVVRRETFADLKQAVELILGMHAAVTRALRATELWGASAVGGRESTPFAISPGLVRVLRHVETPSLGVPRASTHSLTLLDAKRAGRRLGGLTLGVGSEGVTGPGMVLGLTLPRGVTARDAIAVTRVIAELDVSEVTVGPKAIVLETNMGAVAFVQELAEPKIPWSVEPTPRGSWVCAHGERLESESDAALRAIRALARAVPVYLPEPPPAIRPRRSSLSEPAAGPQPIQTVPTYLIHRAAEPPPTDETAAMPPPEDVKRLIREAEPHFAFANAPAVARSSSSSTTDVTAPSDSEETALVPSPLADAGGGSALPFVAPSSAPDGPTEEIDLRSLPGFAAIETLAQIAVAIRGGVAPNVAVSRLGLTEADWRSAQSAVLHDPMKRALFEARVNSLIRGGRR